MDHAVALVQAYLRVNGYFTVSEYPIIESIRHGYRTATDLDILAFRFPGAGRLVPGRGASADEEHFAPDPALGVPPEHADMIVGEVKEGRATLNAAATDPAVLHTVLVRFGCCPAASAGPVVDRLIRDGRTLLPSGHRIRLAAFGSSVNGAGTGKYLTITLCHIVRFLEEYLREHWEIVRHEDQKDLALGFLALLEKARQGAA